MIGQLDAVAHLQCSQIIAAFAHLLDERRHADIVALFTADGEFRRGIDVRRGHSAILEALESRPLDRRTVHVPALPAFHRIGATGATSSTYMTYYERHLPDGTEWAGATAAVVLCDDEFSRVDGCWRLARRTVTPALTTSRR